MICTDGLHKKRVSQLVQNLLRLVLLAEIHSDLVPVSVVERLFGQGAVSLFQEKYPSIPVEQGFIGRGDRTEARSRRAMAATKLDRAHTLIGCITRIPWLLFVGVTGSVAFGNAYEEDDIDLFIVTDDGRIWITRLAEQILYRGKRVRRTFGMSDVSDKICINHYRSEKSLDVRTVPERRFEVALELAMMQPMYNKPYYFRILQENQWVYDFFPNLKERQKAKKDVVTQDVSSQQNRMMDLVDITAMTVQCTYMRVMRHPWEKVRMSRDSIRFCDGNSWRVRNERLGKLLEGYDVG